MNTILLAAEKNQAETIAISGYLGAQYNLLIAETGEQVLDYLNENRVEVVVISMNIKGLDAISTIQFIRKSPIRIPIILLSNIVNLNTLRLAAEENLDEILQIPVHMDSLCEVLHKYFPNQCPFNQQHTLY